MPPAMILCGGQGTRLRSVSEILPKPMVEIGSQPIIWHILKIFSAWGVNRFILCLGYKRELFLDYFLNYRARSSDVTVHLGREPTTIFHECNGALEEWCVTLANTGETTMTGGRVVLAQRHLPRTDEEFFLTYGDGVADVDLKRLLAFHRTQGKAATVSAVHPAGRFGDIEIEDNSAVRFHEKRQTASGWINGGFMVLTRRFIETYLSGDPAEVLEQEPMRRAAQDGEIAAYKHEGFWQCMDTPREHQLLNELWQSGCAPWKASW
jgi:glucose-1-phosphate cytidylyltransferase